MKTRNSGKKISLRCWEVAFCRYAI